MADDTPAFGIRFRRSTNSLPRVGRGEDGKPTTTPPPDRAARASDPPAFPPPPQNPTIIQERQPPAKKVVYGVLDLTDREMIVDPPRVPGTAYQLALDFANTVHTIIELAEMERYMVKDALDRKAMAIAMGMAQAANDPIMSGRRAQYKKMQVMIVECATMLDMLERRGSVEPELLEPARALATQLIDKLTELSTPPPSIY